MSTLTTDRHRQPLLNLDVTLDDADIWGAIEWTLATARRTGLALGRLDLADAPAASARTLRLQVLASDPSLLDLFVKRLENGVDVREVRCRPGGDAQPRRPASSQPSTVLSALPVH